MDDPRDCLAAIERTQDGASFFLRRGALSPGWPMAFDERPALALEAQALLGEGGKKRADFLFSILAQDDQQMFCMPAQPLPREPFSPGRWTWDGAAWSANALDDQGRLFEAPLFAFWLFEAALSKQQRPKAKPERHEHDGLGAKIAVPAWASLAWEWDDPQRVRMCALAWEASQGQRLTELESLMGEPLAAQAARLSPAAWSELASTATPEQRRALRGERERLALERATRSAPKTPARSL